MTSSSREPAPPKQATTVAAPPAKSGFLSKWFPQWQGPFQRERDRIRAEILNFQGLMPLLMQQRNGRRWTADERAQLAQYLRRLTSLSPYVLALLAPGSIFLLPLLAWWLDRRRKKRNENEKGEGEIPGSRNSR